MKNTTAEFFTDLAPSLRLIDEATKEGLPSFLQSARLRAIVEWRLYRIGELSARRRRYLMEEFPAVPWADIIRMRHRLAHHFMKLDPNITFVIAAMDVPKLAFAVRRAFNE